MELKEKIQELLEEKLKEVKILRETLEKLGGEEAQILYADKESDRPKIKKLLGVKRKYTKSGKFKKDAVKKDFKPKSGYRGGGRGHPKFTPQVIEFIKQKYKTTSDKELSALIWEKFEITLGLQTIRHKRKELGFSKRGMYKKRTTEKAPERADEVDDLAEDLDDEN